MTTDYPETLSEYDFLELVAFDSKVEREGYSYAAAEYSPRFEFNNYERINLDDPVASGMLRGLWRANRAALAAFWETADAVDRHNAHIDESDRRREDRSKAAA